ncbi:MAG: hypothetical protein QXS68_06305 [Candidatus Methanomethylicaceae archaeon]
MGRIGSLDKRAFGSQRRLVTIVAAVKNAMNIKDVIFTVMDPTL